MKILQIAPTWYPIRENIKQGSIERVIFYLDREYIRKGHKSLVAASGDSRITGELYPTLDHSTSPFGLKYHLRTTQTHDSKVLERILLGDIDIVHDHICLTFIDRYLNNPIGTPFLTTIHGDDIDKVSRIERIKKLKKIGRKVYITALSNFQKKRMENAGIEVIKVIYHGIPMDEFEFREEKQNYLLWLGRIGEYKGTDLAVKLSKEAGIPLIIAGRVYPPSKRFYRQKVKPFLTFALEETTNPQIATQNETEKNRFLESIDNRERSLKKGEVVYLGPVGNKQKAILYRNAMAFLMPNRWNEPFGLVMVEAMACGTPVIGTNRGSIKEIVEHEKTGLVLPFEDDHQLIEDMTKALGRISEISSKDCRKRVEENFTIEKEAQNNLNLFEGIKNGAY